MSHRVGEENDQEKHVIFLHLLTETSSKFMYTITRRTTVLYTHLDPERDSFHCTNFDPAFVRQSNSFPSSDPYHSNNLLCLIPTRRPHLIQPSTSPMACLAASPTTSVSTPKPSFPVSGRVSCLKSGGGTPLRNAFAWREM
jgi:hypothetical protein